MSGELTDLEKLRAMHAWLEAAMRAGAFGAHQSNKCRFCTARNAAYKLQTLIEWTEGDSGVPATPT